MESVGVPGDAVGQTDVSAMDIDESVRSTVSEAVPAGAVPVSVVSGSQTDVSSMEIGQSVPWGLGLGPTAPLW